MCVVRISSTHVRAPLSCQTSFKKHKFKDKIIKTFMIPAEYQTKHTSLYTKKAKPMFRLQKYILNYYI